MTDAYKACADAEERLLQRLAAEKLESLSPLRPLTRPLTSTEKSVAALGLAVIAIGVPILAPVAVVVSIVNMCRVIRSNS